LRTSAGEDKGKAGQMGRMQPFQPMHSGWIAYANTGSCKVRGWAHGNKCLQPSAGSS